MSDEEKKLYGLSAEDSYDLDEIKARIQKRNQEKLAKKKKARRRVIAILAFIVILGGLAIFSFSSFFTVDHIAVEGNSHFSAEEIINMAHATPGKNLIYDTGRTEIVDYLSQNPYIEKADVKRQLPSTLVIEVKERKEIGALKYDDDFLIIDKTGILLKKTHTEPMLTLIEGLVVKKITLGEKIGTEDSELFEQTLDILNAMNDNDLYFVKLNVADMYIKANIYDTLVCKGTYAQMMDGIEKGRLHTVLYKLFEDGIKRGTITFSDEGYASFEPSL